MLSIFPDLLIYNFLGVTIIRVALGLLGVYLAFKVLSKRNQISDFVASLKIPVTIFAAVSPWILMILFVISGGLMIVGLYTQVACIVLAYLFLKMLFINMFIKDFSESTPIFYLCLIFISLSLLLLGPGAFAYDLPF